MNLLRRALPFLESVDLDGASLAMPLHHGGVIMANERISMVGFDRGARSLVWVARITRHDHDGVQVLVPATVAVKLGLATMATVRDLTATITPEKLASEAAWLGRQAKLDGKRHYEEVRENIRQWMLAFPVIGLPMGLMEEVWPGAAGEVADGLLGAICAAPLTALPAWAVGGCQGKHEAGWIKPVLIGGGLLLGTGLAVGIAMRVAGRRRLMQNE